MRKKVKIMQMKTKNDVQINLLLKRESKTLIYAVHWLVIAQATMTKWSFEFKLFTSLSSLSCKWNDPIEPFFLLSILTEKSQMNPMC